MNFLEPPHVIFPNSLSTRRQFLTSAGVISAIGPLATLELAAQQNNDVIFDVKVDLVMVTCNVTDNKGKHVAGLTAGDLRVTEDGIQQNIVAFGEAGAPGTRLSSEIPEGASVFVLLDSSDAMYKGFVYACDAAAEFVRRLNEANSIAVYTFSSNLSRLAPLSKDRHATLTSLRNAVAGASTALYNSLLLTLRDAARVAGRKAVVVFSNGPDTASVIAPDDVRAVAEDEGIPIYMISTEESRQHSISGRVFRRLTSLTGGEIYWARDWQRQAQAFASVRERIDSTYTFAYYPAPNPNQEFRTIRVEVISVPGNRYRVGARSGYRPKPMPVPARSDL